MLLKDLREKQGMTRNMVYKETGINIRRIEARCPDLGMETLYKLTGLYAITLDNFFHELSIRLNCLTAEPFEIIDDSDKPSKSLHKSQLEQNESVVLCKVTA